MPCYEPSEGDRNRADLQRSNSINSMLRDDIARLTGMLCAVLNACKHRVSLDIFIADAEENGKISGIREFWEEHCRDDRDRLAEKLGEFSEHEREILRELLK